MKSRIILFTVLLLLWIGFCSWYYVCKVQSNCSAITERIPETVSMSPAPVSMPAADSVAEILPPSSHVIYFSSGNNRCVVSEEDNEYLSEVSSFIKENPNYRVEVLGYADNIGTESINLKISSLRAEFIAGKLIEAGIPESIISFEGKGEADPVAENSTEQGRSLNRRVNIITHKN